MTYGGTMSEERPTNEGSSSAGGPPRVPRWVKGLVVALIVAVTVVVVLMVLGVGGEHGPGRHG
jgi:hypothetical protein